MSELTDRWHAFNSSFDHYWLDFGRLDAPFVIEALNKLKSSTQPRIIDLMTSPAALILCFRTKTVSTEC